MSIERGVFKSCALTFKGQFWCRSTSFTLTTGLFCRANVPDLCYTISLGSFVGRPCLERTEISLHSML